MQVAQSALKIAPTDAETPQELLVKVHIDGRSVSTARGYATSATARSSRSAFRLRRRGRRFVAEGAGASPLTAGGDHSNQNHSGENHSNQDLTSITLTNSNLSSANLKNSIFVLALINNADLSGANLKGADFTGAILDGSDFSGSNIKDSDFSGASLIGADFTVGNWAGAVFTGAVYDSTTRFAPGFDLSSMVSTPEPSPGLLVSLGLMGLAVYSRRISHRSRARLTT